MSSKFEKAGITGEIIFQTRFPNGATGDKVAWTEVENLLLDRFYGGRANRGKGTIDSAIPLRRMLQVYLANEAGGLMKPGLKSTQKKVVELRHRGLGWPAIQARMVEGTTVKQVQDDYVAGGGNQPTEGRLYVRADGSLHWVGESTAAIHKARQEGSKPAEATEETKPAEASNVTVISPDGEVTPPAKKRSANRRRRTPKAAA
jgi:hypothetical protein